MMYNMIEKLLGWILLILGVIGILISLYVLTVSAIHFHTVKRLYICLLAIGIGIVLVMIHKERKKHE